MAAPTAETEDASTPQWRLLPATDADRVHRELCPQGPSTCALCIWADKKGQWERKCLITADDPDRGCWVQGGHWKKGLTDEDPLMPGLGCKVCASCGRERKPETIKWARYGKRSPFALTHLLKHARSQGHQMALGEYLDDKGLLKRASPELRSMAFAEAANRYLDETAERRVDQVAKRPRLNGDTRRDFMRLVAVYRARVDAAASGH